MNCKSGFSLIELMVVIAIVGLLAAVAVPSYKQYLANSRLADVVSVMDGFLEKAKVYHDLSTNPLHAYPNATFFGLSTGQIEGQCPGADCVASADLASLSPYLTQAFMNSFEARPYNNVDNNIFNLEFDLDAAAMGFDPTIVTMHLTCLLFRNANSGSYEQQCFYSYGT